VLPRLGGRWWWWGNIVDGIGVAVAINLFGWRLETVVFVFFHFLAKRHCI
jgi:hypothetical protein